MSKVVLGGVQQQHQCHLATSMGFEQELSDMLLMKTFELMVRHIENSFCCSSPKVTSCEYF